MILPDLNSYRTTFFKKGISYPLSPVRSNRNGLLSELPIPLEGGVGWPWQEETNAKIYSDRIDWPKLTIVTPSYNQAAFLEQTIRSVLLQNYPNLEYIVVDGGSNDGSQEIIERYSPWISFWQSEKDDGQGQAINKGFSLASGNYFGWINSDDYYLKDVFHIVIEQFLIKKKEFIYGYAYNFNVVSKEMSLIKLLPFIDYFIKIPTLAQPSCFWSADIHQPIWEELNCSLDFELWLRMVKGQTRQLIKLPLSVANIHQDAKTTDPKMKERWHTDHLKIWSPEGHGTVYEWHRISFLFRLRKRIYKLLHLD